MRKSSLSPDVVLTARPGQVTTTATPGIRPLGLGQKRDGLLYVPETNPVGPLPLIVMLHGAGGDGASMFHMMQRGAEQGSCLLLLPDARRHTWDFLIEGFGPDVRFLDKALEQTFSSCDVDPSRVAIAGFSDGASYALTLGLSNGDLFTHVIAFSPGFMAPPRLFGHPTIFVSHGTGDEVLPITVCSRRLVPQLESLGYDLLYREFDGPHTVPHAILHEAVQWFLEPR